MILRCRSKRLKFPILLLIKTALLVAMIYSVISYRRTITSFVYQVCCSDYAIVLGINHKGSVPPNSSQKYIFVVPRKTKQTKCGRKQTSGICQGVQKLIRILDEYSYLDGATCHGLDHIRERASQKRILSCRFETKFWTLRITQTTGVEPLTLCNLVEGPFLIRRSVFDELGFRPSHGETTLLDFFLRSSGSIIIAASRECSFLAQQLVTDRGEMSGKEVYLDYGLLGFHHNILRVVRDDSITWTKCTKNTTLCPDKPLHESLHSRDTAMAELFPLCCHERLDQYLIDSVLALEKVNVSYRLCMGTVLGAVRTRGIIPWTDDIDICIRSTDYKNANTFFQIEKILSAKRYSSPVIFTVRRIMPMFPLTRNISLNSLSENNLYNEKVLGQMEYVLPIERPKWNSMGYVDVYPMDNLFRTKPSSIVINNRRYTTVGDPHFYLVGAFGESYLQVNYSGRSLDPLMPSLLWKREVNVTQEDFSVE